MSGMSKGASKPRRRPPGRKQDILNVARKLFVDYGYPNVTMAMIAERLDITAGALYRHYSNKAALLEAVFEDRFAHLIDPPEGDDLEEFFERVRQPRAEPLFTAELWRGEARHLPKESYQAFRALILQWVGRLTECIGALRPELSASQAEFIAWAMQSVLSMPHIIQSGWNKEQAAQITLGLLHRLERLELLPLEDLPEPKVEALPPVHSTRERLLLAATQQFGENGFRATSITEIGAAAGVTGPNLYGHFDDKTALFLAAMTRGRHASWLAMGRAMAAGDSPEERVRNMVGEHVDLERLWTQVRLNAIPGDEEATARLFHTQSEYIAEWVEELRAARSDLGRSEARDRVLIAFTLVDDLRRTRFLVRRSNFRENLIRTLTTVLLEEDRPRTSSNL